MSNAEGNGAAATPDPTDPTSGEAADRLLPHLDELVDPERLDAVREFARAMLRRVPDAQIAGADPEALANEIAAAFRFFADRGTDRVAIRTVDPDVAIDGWSDPGTVIEVATDDRPFLLTTITEELSHLGHDVVRSFHPILGVRRHDDGRIAAIGPARGAEHRESLVHVEVAQQLSEERQQEVRAAVRSVLQDVIAATRDFARMRQRVEQVATRLRAHAAEADGAQRDATTVDDPQGDAAEVAALLEWLLDDNFVLLGCRTYEVTGSEDVPAVRVEPGSGLGILSDDTDSKYRDPVPLDDADASMRERHEAGRVLTVARSHRFSTVRRRVRMLNVWIRLVDGTGRTTGQFRLLGMFARKARSVATSDIPVLRRKLDAILEREDVVEQSHDERTFVSLFQAMPKDELLELDVPELHRTLLGLFEVEEQRGIGVFLRVDEAAHNVSVIVAVPRDRYDAAFRKRVQALLRERFGARNVEVDLSLGDRPETVARFSLHVPADREMPDVSGVDLEEEILDLARTWEDDVTSLLCERLGEAEGHHLAATYATRFPTTYRQHTAVEQAADDVETIAELDRSGDELLIRLHEDRSPGRPLTRLKIVQAGTGIELSSILPILENLGLTVTEELPFKLRPGAGDAPEIHIHDYGVHVGGELVDIDRDGDRLADALLACWRRQLEVDSLNRLVLEAQLDWPAVAVFRAYRRYRRQVGTAYTAEYQNDALVENPDATRALIDLFDARFNPDRAPSDDDIAKLREQVTVCCDAVERLDHDRILRTFLALVDATLRTNRYRHEPPGCIALKFDSGAVPQVPKPVPYREVFVYAPEMEGIHLRGGRIARGGIRWSDRRDDFRTEVLGLMQAQTLKNAVIVPTGAKGGFVLKRPPAQRADVPVAVERWYRRYIHALLEITDNVVGEEVHVPDSVRRADGDDPYLVVAADRGTARLSDTANAIADEHGFWLGDAFASGGSRGYDHKALGITARGAWVAVQRHFRELGIDVQTEPISVVGVGDMSGDVFGNGMLQSSAIQLVAAFDHRDILLDPDPDPSASFEERLRLFGDPSLTWQDHSREVISEGGGVWSRSGKRIPLSPQVRELLRVDAEVLTPPELIRAILRAPVDLLFAGGIGTFVKASHESDEDIGDRVNDEIRITATELRARVVGEGANLAITQPGRIQYARRGGRCNTDFIDNSAGVDISDHEVNIKILLQLAGEREGLSATERDQLLGDVTEDVVAACLTDVGRQTMILSQEAAASPERMDVHEAQMAHLEAAGILERTVEYLPTTEEMTERNEAGAGLTRPELAVLLAATKRDLSGELVASDLIEQPSLHPVLESYFPDRLVDRFPDLLAEHRLRRELIATVVANDIVDRLGITLTHRLARELGTSRSEVVAAYWVARQVAAADRHWDTIDRIDREHGPQLAMDLKQDVDQLLETLIREYVRSGDLDALGAAIDRDTPVFRAVEEVLGAEGRLDHVRTRRAEQLVDTGLQPDEALRFVRISDLAIAPDVGAVGRAVGREVPGIAEAFLAIGDALGFEHLRRMLDRVEPQDRWAQWQYRGLVDDLRALHRVAVHRALTEHPGADETAAVDRFLARRQEATSHALRLQRAIEEDGQPRLDAVSVAMRAVRDVLRSTGRA